MSLVGGTVLGLPGALRFWTEGCPWSAEWLRGSWSLSFLRKDFRLSSIHLSLLDGVFENFANFAKIINIFY